MDTENKEEEYEIRISEEWLKNIEANMIVSEEDLKFSDSGKGVTLKQETVYINRNYDFLFSEEKEAKIVKTAQKFYLHLAEGKRIKSIATFLRLQMMEKVKRFYLEHFEIDEYIQLLTSNDEENIKKVKESMKEMGILEEKNGVTKIKTSFGEIKFSKISDFFPELDVDTEELENIKKEADIVTVMQ